MHEVRACETARNQRKEREMTLDTDKIDDAALAILSLTLHDGDRVWKGIDWNLSLIHI